MAEIVKTNGRKIKNGIRQNVFLRLGRDYRIVLITLLIFIVAAFTTPNFITRTNIINVLRQASIQGFVAIGMTFVILSGGIDLSVGSVVALSSVLVAGISKTLPPIIGIYVALGCGLLIGLANGFLVNRLKFQPIIATLALMAIVRGGAMRYSNSLPIFGTLPNEYFVLSQGSVFGFPLPTFLFFLTSIAVGLFLNRMPLGRKIYQVGGNEEASRLAGVKVQNVKYFVYAASGICAAFAGLVLAARMQSGDSVRTGIGWELDAIAAVVIGGTSLKGGVGKIFGTVCGVIIAAMITNIFNLLGINPYWQRIVIGLIICVAVISYQERGARKRSRFFRKRGAVVAEKST